MSGGVSDARSSGDRHRKIGCFIGKDRQGTGFQKTGKEGAKGTIAGSGHRV